MRNKIQKYLSGDHEGFSLVELIIVIAIMAILIGVVALAVLPYLEKSRESKDLSTMDTICSALVTAVADTQAKGGDCWVFGTKTDSNGKASDTTEVASVEESMKSTMGSASTTLKSSALSASGVSLYCYYNATSNVAFVYAGSATGPVNLNRTITGYDGLDGSISSKTAVPKQADGKKSAIVSN